MSLFYLETSALAKRYKQERGTEIIASLFEQKGVDDRLISSYLAPVELAGAATRLKKSGALSASAVSQFISAFKQDFLQEIEVFPVNDVILASAIMLAESHGLRAADSIHLATMVDLQRACIEAEVPFFAFIVDRSLREAAAAERVSFLNPEDGNASERLEQFRKSTR